MTPAYVRRNGKHTDQLAKQSAEQPPSQLSRGTAASWAVIYDPRRKKNFLGPFVTKSELHSEIRHWNARTDRSRRFVNETVY